MTVTMQFPEEMRERLRVISKWPGTIKETDSDWELLGQQWEQQIFLQKDKR